MAKNTNRLNQQDLLAKDTLEVSSFLIYNSEYRKISNDAKLMYQYMLKRYSLTEHKLEIAQEENTLEDFTFIDDNGDLFCYVSNDELRFVLNLSEPTVKKCKKELASVGLLEEVKQTMYKTNRLYLNRVNMNAEVKRDYQDELKAFREIERAKRKVRNDKRKVKKTKPSLHNASVPIEQNNFTFNKNENSEKLNIKDFHSMNSQNFGQSTKEVLSTEEKEFKDLDDDKRDTAAPSLTEDKISEIINELRESTKDDINERSFKTVVTKVMSKYDKGDVTNLRDYLVTSLTNKIEQLELRRIKDDAKKAIKHTRNDDKLEEVKISPNAVPFYNWLKDDESEDDE